MRALFGCGLHPLAELRQQQLEGPDLTERDSADLERCRRQHEWEFLRPSRVPDRRPEEMLAGLWWYQAWSAAFNLYPRRDSNPRYRLERAAC